MKKRRFKQALSALLVLGVFRLAAIDWPVEDAVLRANFGKNQKGMPSLGTAFETAGPIRASEAGDLLFTHNPVERASRLPSPLGAWTALDHGDGIISIYSRYSELETVAVPDKVERGGVIAMAGQSGWSEKQGFYFSFFDRKERRWVNPSRLIAPMPDTSPPVIYSVDLRGADGKAVSLNQAKNISQGRYTISVGASDGRLPDQEPVLAPYRILCSVNGLEAGEFVFETFAARDGVLMVYRNGLAPVRQVYRAFPAYDIGDVWFTRGQATVEILVQDISGNSRSVTYKLQID